MDQKTKGRRFTPVAAGKDFRLEFQTPAIVAKHMVKMLPAGIRTVLEPTPGIGRIARELTLAGFDVTAPDDFFALKPQRFDAIVMNPPFSAKTAFNIPEGFEHTGMRLGYYMLRECMKMSDCVIALMPWFTITDSDVRQRAMMKWGMKSVTSLPRKTFDYARIQTCIIDLRKHWPFHTEFNIFDHNVQPELEIDGNGKVD